MSRYFQLVRLPVRCIFHQTPCINIQPTLTSLIQLLFCSASSSSSSFFQVVPRNFQTLRSSVVAGRSPEFVGDSSPPLGFFPSADGVGVFIFDEWVLFHQLRQDYFFILSEVWCPFFSIFHHSAIGNEKDQF